MKYLLLTISALLLMIVACQPDVQLSARTPTLPAVPYDYATPVAASFFNPFGDSVIDNDVATLGRVLFYDTQLSKNNRISCGTCHMQIYGFADNSQWSIGFQNGLTGRNTQTIVNTGTQTGFFWDLREATLDHMVLQPIANHIEMGVADTLYMEEKVRRTDYYTALFQNAFGSTEVTSKKIGLALAQFVKSITSVSSKFDDGMMMLGAPSVTDAAFDEMPNFTAEENLGMDLFFSKFPCSSCHGGVNLDGSLSFPHNVGLDVDYADNGMPGIVAVDFGEDTVYYERDGFFKTPSLRNISLTAPYMHDGRFNTLEEVIEFYNSGIQPHPQLSQTLRKHTDGGIWNLGPPIPDEEEPAGRRPLKMYMTTEEKQALVAFMKTLTDYQLIGDPRFSDPFAQ